MSSKTYFNSFLQSQDKKKEKHSTHDFHISTTGASDWSLVNSSYKFIRKSVYLEIGGQQRKGRRHTVCTLFSSPLLHRRSTTCQSLRPIRTPAARPEFTAQSLLFGLAQSFPQDICWLILKLCQVKPRHGCESSVGDMSDVIRLKRSGIRISGLNHPVGE